MPDLNLARYRALEECDAWGVAPGTSDFEDGNGNTFESLDDLADSIIARTAPAAAKLAEYVSAHGCIDCGTNTEHHDEGCETSAAIRKGTRNV